MKKTRKMEGLYSFEDDKMLIVVEFNIGENKRDWINRKEFNYSYTPSTLQFILSIEEVEIFEREQKNVPLS